MVKSLGKKFKTMLIGYTIIFVLFFLGSINVGAIGEPEYDYFDQYTVKAYQAPVINSITTPAAGDIVTIQVTKGTYSIASFYVFDVNNQANSFTVEVGKELSTYYLSLRNGTYRIYVTDTSGQSTAFNYAITVNTSCSNETVTNATGSGTVKRCFLYYGSTTKPDQAGDIVTCKAGYVLDTSASGLMTDSCKDYSSASLNQYQVSRRFCERVYQYKCVAQTTQNSSKLKDLSLSSGTLSPTFNADTTSYTATVNGSSVSIDATLNNDGSSFETGYGPRTVNLNYGTNTFAIKVKSSSGNVTTYTIKITRPDNRSKVNTLSALYIDGVKLNESFSSSKTSYTATVGSDVEKVYINATLTNSNASFVKGYGPRTVTLTTGGNTILIKVKSQAGTTKTYTLKITKQGAQEPEEPIIDTENLGLLKSLSFPETEANLEPQFDPKNLEYNITVPFEVSTLLIDAIAENATDQITIEGNEELVVEEANVVTIKVTTKEDFIRVYTINVIRKGEDIEISNDSSLKELSIKGHDELEFKVEEEKYDLILHKDETKLDITATANSEKATIEVLNNEELSTGASVTVRVLAEDGSFTDYIINITGVEKGANVFLIVIIVLVLVLIIAYTILRLLGYKIYFNFSMLGSLFRSKNKDE